MVLTDHKLLPSRGRTRLLQFTMLRMVIAVVLCLLLIAFLPPATAQEGNLVRPLVASGSSLNSEPDSADARNLALEDALRNAVEQSLGWLLPAERIVRFYPLLLDRILAEPMGYVQDYQIIHEDVRSGLYRVTVQTTLYSEGLKRDLRRLGLFLAASERPRIVIFVAERAAPEAPWHWWWQMPTLEDQHLVFSQELIQDTMARGLVPLDPSLLLDGFPDDPVYQEPFLNDAQGAALAKALGAQVAVLGQVSQVPASAEALASASGFLRAVRADNGSILARVSATVQAQLPSEQQAEHVFVTLAKRLAPPLVDGILAPFAEVSLVSREITLQVQGSRTYSDLIQIKEYLQHAPGVKEIRQIQLQTYGGSFALFFEGSLDSLRAALASHDFGSFATSVESTSENVLTLTIISKR